MTVSLNESKYSIEPSDYRCSACSGDVVPEAAFFSAVFFEGEAFRRRSYCVPCWDPARSDLGAAYAFWKSRRPAPHAPARKLRFDPELILEFFRRLGSAVSPGGTAASAKTDGTEDGRTTAAGGTDRGGTTTEDGTTMDGPALAPVTEASPAPPAAEPAPPAARSILPAEAARLRLVLSLLLIRRKVLVLDGSGLRDGREWLRLSEKAAPERTYLIENPPMTDAELETVRLSLGELLQMDIA